MPKANVRVDTNFEEGMKTANKLSEEIPDNIKDARQKIADSFIRESQRTLQKNGSVVTGTGITSFTRRELGQHSTGVFAASYLQDVDTGTSAHWPDTNNYRFIAAARSYGMERAELARVIAQRGTRPHPWIDESTKKIRRKSGTMLSVALQNAVQSSLSNF